MPRSGSWFASQQHASILTGKERTSMTRRAQLYAGSKINRWMVLFVTALFFLCCLSSQAQELAPVKASQDRPLLDNPQAGWGADYTNWAEFSVGGFIVDGSKAALQQRQQLPATAFGGIESFHLEQPVGSNGVFKVDGRALFDNNDYDIKLDYTVEELGYLRAGY